MSEDHLPGSVETYALVALGGFAGANARHLADVDIGGLPATLLVNAVGSALLGFVLYEEAHLGVLSRRLRIVVGTGFLSSLTTYSTFALQTAQATPLLAAGNFSANYALAITGVALGRSVALALARRADA